jgi:hypothetical protein
MKGRPGGWENELLVAYLLPTGHVPADSVPLVGSAFLWGGKVYCRLWHPKARAAKLVSAPSALAVERGGQYPFRKDTTMLHRTCIALLIALSACATTNPSPAERKDPNPRFANLQRAAQYPWTDGGHCVVREASNEWPVLAERCFHALDHDRVRFQDVTGQCAVSSAPAAAATLGGIGLCLFASPVVVTGAVIVIGTVVVAVVIKEGLDAYERSASRERAKPKAQTQPAKEPLANRAPQPKGSGTGDFFPPPPETTPRRPSCEPFPVRHAGEDVPHNECADKFPPNRYPGMDVFVGGERFDALQVGVRVLWEIKTHRFDTYPDFIQEREIEKEVAQLTKELAAARACGYDFVVGVSTQAHRLALLAEIPTLNVVVTGCTR